MGIVDTDGWVVKIGELDVLLVGGGILAAGVLETGGWVLAAPVVLTVCFVEAGTLDIVLGVAGVEPGGDEAGEEVVLPDALQADISARVAITPLPTVMPKRRRTCLREKLFGRKASGFLLKLPSLIFDMLFYSLRFSGCRRQLC